MRLSVFWLGSQKRPEYQDPREGEEFPIAGYGHFVKRSGAFFFVAKQVSHEAASRGSRQALETMKLNGRVIARTGTYPIQKGNQAVFFYPEDGTTQVVTVVE